ncbi:hypothetical protein SAMN05216482_9166 [Streptomyces sp. PAN_FS17]|nr:hypothetical protein SAMN05216482_9166 [Streptomyces sp. PAN_FS17]
MWARTEDPIAENCDVSLHEPPELIVFQVLFGLQERARACLKSKPTDLRAVVNIARRNQVASLESSDRSLLDPRYMSMRNSLMRFVTLALASPETEVVKDIWNAEVFGFRGRIWFTDISQHWLREATKRRAVSTTCPVAEASMPPGWSKDASIRSPSRRPRLRLRQVPATGGWLEGDAVGIEREAGVSRMFLLGNRPGASGRQALVPPDSRRAVRPCRRFPSGSPSAVPRVRPTGSCRGVTGSGHRVHLLRESSPHAAAGTTPWLRLILQMAVSGSGRSLPPRSPRCRGWRTRRGWRTPTP